MQRHFSQAMERMEGLINNWSASSSVLVAVSGGIDSMCLADLFFRAYGPGSFALAHCNFHLRGEESDADEKLVRDWAEKHGVSCHVADFQTESYAVEHGISIEMAARELRYTWFGELCDKHGYPAVAVAHNANDNAETLLLNLLRGTGLRGLSGMSSVSDLPHGNSGTRLIRPILECTRKMIEGYAFVNKVAYREDSTNASSDYKRNRIRNEVFPIFEKINPSFVRTLNREMEYFSEALEVVDDYCSAEARQVWNVDGTSISIPSLLEHPRWHYLLYHMLEPYGFNSSVLASLEELLESGRTVSGKRFESQTCELVIERQDICIRPKKSQASLEPEMDESPVMPVRGPGIYNFNGRRWQVEVLERTPQMNLRQPEGVLIADADRLSFPFVCRRWRQGDWFIPFGMKGRKKVSDMFADLKFTGIQKDDAVMIVDCDAEMAERQHIAGILGVRMDDRYKVTETTSSIIKITILS